LTFVLAFIVASMLIDPLSGQDRDTTRGDRMIAAYFSSRTQQLSDRCLAEFQSLEDWQAQQTKLRQQLFEMLSLDPLPEKTPLKPVITGSVEHDEFIVERLHFQSRPGLYVTGNLYRPKSQTGPLPAILYVCGHGRVKKGDISYGNKAHYQHHGAWFARNGYVCLTIDTLQLGEIEGIHHGTYNHDRWWWNARGYSSAGVEAWNCIRSLDYLQSRTEVDGERIGVTGRSGGGAYSWWIAALDERIKVAVPVAGITSLQNHVVDGCVEGHCDCMFMVNTYRWDYAQVAALVAPRPLLISNTDKDGIFPLDGVVDVYNKVRRIYELHGKLKNVGLQITEGPHKDTQELRVHAFHWFNKFLKGEDPLIETTAVKFFEPEQLRVFSELPGDEQNTTIDETFTQVARLPDPVDVAINDGSSESYRRQLLEKCFRGWPNLKDVSAISKSLHVGPTEQKNGVMLSQFTFTPEPDIDLNLYLLRSAKTAPQDLKLVVLNVLDESGWSDFLSEVGVDFASQFKGEVAVETNTDAWKSTSQMLTSLPWGMAYVCPRGIGPTAWDQSKRKQTQHRRRFMLLGQTQDSMRVWDVRRALNALQAVEGLKEVPLWLQAQGVMSGVALYAALFESGKVTRLDLYDLPASHREGPIFLNVLRITDLPLTVPYVAHTSKVVIYDNEADRWSYAREIADSDERLKSQLQIRKRP